MDVLIQKKICGLQLTRLVTSHYGVQEIVVTVVESSMSLGFGIISHIISHERGKKEAFGNLAIMFAILAIGLFDMSRKTNRSFIFLTMKIRREH